VGFVGREGVPDEETTVLRGGHEVDRVAGPVHGVNFGEVTFESTARTRSGRTIGLFVDRVEVLF